MIVSDFNNRNVYAARAITDKQKNDLVAAARLSKKMLMHLIHTISLVPPCLVMTGDLHRVNISKCVVWLDGCGKNGRFQHDQHRQTKASRPSPSVVKEKFPCGACRQYWLNFAGDVPVYLTSSQGEIFHTLLPLLFDSSDLKRARNHHAED